jgi:hypothetical protein
VYLTLVRYSVGVFVCEELVPNDPTSVTILAPSSRLGFLAEMMPAPSQVMVLSRDVGTHHRALRSAKFPWMNPTDVEALRLSLSSPDLRRHGLLHTKPQWSHGVGRVWSRGLCRRVCASAVRVQPQPLRTEFRAVRAASHLYRSRRWCISTSGSTTIGR